jgi:predicted nucleic acid-binding protein
VVLTDESDLVTSDHVLVETWLLLRHRLGRAAAETFWDGIRAGLATLECVGPLDLEAAHAIGEQFEDQDFSLVDRTSFALMQRLGIERAATLDAHFSVYRYGRRREKAFIVVH